jgi:hypothetical protein
MVGQFRSYLDTVISVRVSQQFLKPRPIQQLFNDHLSGILLCNANALKILFSNENRTRIVLLTFSMTLELNFCTERAQIFPVNWRMRASLKRFSLRSRIYCTTCHSISTNGRCQKFRKTYVVPIGVLNQCERIISYLIHHLNSLCL